MSSLPGEAPRDTLLRAVETLGIQARDDALHQFSKMAYTSGRVDLIDERVLKELVRAVNTNPERFEKKLLASIASEVNSKTVAGMKRPAPLYVLQLLLASNHYTQLAHAMIVQSRDVYRAEGQFDYIRSVQQVFARTKLDAADAREALNALERNGIRDIPLLSAICGALEGTGWSPELSDFAERAMSQLSNNPPMLEVIPPATVMALLQFQVRQSDEHKLRVAARLVGSVNAYQKGKTGLSATHHAYKLLESNERTKRLAMEVVRQYVREAADKPAQYSIKFYGQQLGATIGRRLQLSYEFSNLIGRMDWQTYAEALQITVDLLQNAVEAYADKNRRPNLGQLRLMTENLRRDTNIARHRDIHRELRQLAQSVVILGQRHEKRSSENERHIESIITGTTDPRSTLDVFRAAGGYLLDGKVHPLRTKEGDFDRPLGDLQGEDLVVNLTIASNLLHQATNARPSSRNMWTYQALVDEISSQTKAQLSNTQDNLRQMGRNWQRLADLIVWINRESDTRIVEDNHSKGRKLDEHQTAAESPLELFRFIYGGFAGK